MDLGARKEAKLLLRLAAAVPLRPVHSNNLAGFVLVVGDSIF